MNLIVEQLKQLVAGELPRENKLLNTTRLDVFGQSIWGHRAITEFFIEQPLKNIFSSAHVTCSEDLVAMVGVDEQSNTFGLFCETVNGNMLRIWLVGPRDSEPMKPGEYVSVAFDPMLSQQPQRVGFECDEHHNLSKAGAQHVQRLASDLCDPLQLEGELAKSRRKAFVLRAFSNDDEGAALIAVHTLQMGTQRQSSFDYVVVTFKFDGEQLLHSVSAHDRVLANAWCPRIAVSELCVESEDQSQSHI